jgi:hypothetical protein
MPFKCVVLPGCEKKALDPGWKHLGFEYSYLKLSDEAKTKYFDWDDAKRVANKDPDCLHTSIQEDFADERFHGFEIMVPEDFIAEGNDKHDFVKKHMKVVTEPNPWPVEQVMFVGAKGNTSEDRLSTLLSLGMTLETVDLKGVKPKFIAKYVQDIMIRENQTRGWSPTELVLHYKDSVLQSTRVTLADTSAEVVVLGEQLSAIAVK